MATSAALSGVTYLENDTTNQHAQEFRQAIRAVAGNKGGVADYDHFKTQVGGTWTTTVTAGAIVVPGAAGGNGPYVAYSTGSLQLTHTSAGASDRHDLIVVYVEDTEYGDSSDSATITVVEGTPGGGEPSVGYGRYIVVAKILVPGSASSITAANHYDRRPRIGGTPVLTAQRVTASNQSISTTTFTPIQWGGSERDELQMYQPGISQDTFTIPTGYSGLWRLTCYAQWVGINGSQNGQRKLRLTLNIGGSGFTNDMEHHADKMQTGITQRPSHFLYRLIEMNAGDQFRWSLGCNGATAGEALLEEAWMTAEFVGYV